MPLPYKEPSRKNMYMSDWDAAGKALFCIKNRCVHVDCPSVTEKAQFRRPQKYVAQGISGQWGLSRKQKNAARVESEVMRKERMV